MTAMPPSPTVQEQRPSEETVAAQPIHPDFLDRLDQDFINYYNTYLARSRPAGSLSIEETRASRAQFTKRSNRDYSTAACVQDIQLKSGDGYVFTVRLYRPDPRTSSFGIGPYPVHVNFHGGGFTFGDLSTDAAICMKIRSRLGILVADVDYRLRPEHNQGKGHEDCWATVQWIHSYGASINARPDSMSIGGISAGGHITAAVQQLARDAEIPLVIATMGVPTVVTHTDYEKPSDSEFPSFVENQFAPCLNWERMQFYKDNASRFEEAAGSGSQGGSDPDDPELPDVYVNPLHGDLAGCCAAFIGTASADPLRDEGEAYARRLVEAGARTTLRRYHGVPHPFMHFPIAKAAMYLDDVCDALRSAHRIGIPSLQQQMQAAVRLQQQQQQQQQQRQNNVAIVRRKKIFQSVMPRRPAVVAAAAAAAANGAGPGVGAGALPTSPIRLGAARSFTWSPGRLALAGKKQGKRKQF